VTTRTIYPNATGTGSWLMQTQTSYTHPGPYLDRNLIRLPQVVSVTDPNYGMLSQVAYAYDEFGTPGNGRSGYLDGSMGSVRGNPTTVTTFELAGAGRTFSTWTHYYDTGDVNTVTDPRFNTTTSNVDGRRCPDAPQLTHSVSNALGHTTVTVADCYTGNKL